MPKYTVNHDGFIDNTYRYKGDVVEYHERAARYLIAPYGDNLTPVVEEEPAAVEEPDAEESAKPARRRRAADE